MITIDIYKASDNKYLESAYGETMAIAVKRAKMKALRLRPQLQSNLYLRDCLGGLRAEIIMRDGKAIAKVTP